MNSISTISGDDVFISGVSRVKKFKNLLKTHDTRGGIFVSERKTQALPYTTRQVVLGLVVNKNLSVDKDTRSGLLPVWWTPTYAHSAFISNSMGLRYPSVECRRRGL